MKSIVKEIVDCLSEVYDVDQAKALAYWTLEECLHVSRTDILIGNFHVETEQKQLLDDVVSRLLQHEPIQYIFGHTYWGGLELKVSGDTLIPRPETADILSLISRSEEHLRVIDLGTGTGCIAIAIKRLHPTWSVTGVDISEGALCVAKENAILNGVDVKWVRADILSDEDLGRYDLVVSNPPYIRRNERETMGENVLRYEPEGALFVEDDDPLCFYRAIAQKHLSPCLCLEINEKLGRETMDLLTEYGYTHIRLHQDIYGKDRFITTGISR